MMTNKQWGSLLTPVVLRVAMLAVGVGVAAAIGVQAGLGLAGAKVSAATSTSLIVIRMYTGFESNEPIINQYLQMYEKSHPGIKVENLGSEWDVNKLTTLFAAGQAPDIIQHSTDYIQQLYRQGFVAAVPTELADRLRQKFYPVLLQAVLVQGRLAGVPTENMVTGLWYNNRVLDEAGIASQPATFTDLEKIGLRLSKFAGDGRRERAGLVEQGEWWSFNQFGWATFKALGGQVIDATTGKLVVDGQPLRDLLAMVPRWIGARGFMGQGWDQVTAFFKGEVPYGFGYLWWSTLIRESNPSNYLKTFGVGLYPKGAGGNGALHYAHAYAVNSKSKHADEAWKLLEWLALQPVDGVTPLGHALSAKSLPVNSDDFQAKYYDAFRPWAAGFIANLQYAWNDSQFVSYGIGPGDLDFATAMWVVRDGKANPAQAVEDLVTKAQNKIKQFQAAQGK